RHRVGAGAPQPGRAGDRVQRLAVRGGNRAIPRAGGQGVSAQVVHGGGALEHPALRPRFLAPGGSPRGSSPTVDSGVIRGDDTGCGASGWPVRSAARFQRLSSLKGLPMTKRFVVLGFLVGLLALGGGGHAQEGSAPKNKRLVYVVKHGDAKDLAGLLARHFKDDADIQALPESP